MIHDINQEDLTFEDALVVCHNYDADDESTWFIDELEEIRDENDKEKNIYEENLTIVDLTEDTEMKKKEDITMLREENIRIKKEKFIRMQKEEYLRMQQEENMRRKKKKI